MNWAGLIAVIATLSLGMTLMGAVLIAVWQGRPLGKEGSEAIIAIVAVLGGVVTAIAAKMVYDKMNGNDKDKPNG